MFAAAPPCVKSRATADNVLKLLGLQLTMYCNY
jgi:hypothetical protein